ncbi:hypothetical protein EVAR_63662_1 [Eumeta japonica]|uniref:Uncharacterized protein n=1 Tax=Eumeta variegata TaxID=151549 RepID=A0A4C2ADR9_EUMVA|nr:hypothetical protein EVAR_63662_1 [Eumeta japonica]
MVHILLKKLDHSTQALFEPSLEDNKKLVRLCELLRFIEHRFQALETREKSYESGGGKDRAKPITAAASPMPNCHICGMAGHPIYYCERFLKMPPAERLQLVQKKTLRNCF